ncbi:uncharacterized protein LOC119772224 isoform X2 [Cyprinodon tularosa]|uniref:uncharacterized protein LOC119772224 isoform X2 n=1 Tax=Cyprinodon tularosa TaxID=77115 RepID=UPI0018E283B2|nr:uncharacterized protein LOC119772224 isoform X2 [Cyprinodon tularosa]
MFQPVSHCPTVIMFILKQAALLFIQLLNTGCIFAAPAIKDHRDVLVSRGDSVLFICNISNLDSTFILWTKDRPYFIYSTSFNQTFSNFSSNRLRIEANMPSTLNIICVQHDDAGVYTCNTTGKKGINSMTWNLTVLETQNEISFSEYVTFTLSSALGLLLCCTALAVCLCSKKNKTRDRTWNLSNSSIFSCTEYTVQLGEKEAIPSHSKAKPTRKRIGKEDQAASQITLRKKSRRETSELNNT